MQFRTILTLSYGFYGGCTDSFDFYMVNLIKFTFIVNIFTINWQFCLKIWWGMKYWLPHQIKVWWGNCPTCHTYSAPHGLNGRIKESLKITKREKEKWNVMCIAKCNANNLKHCSIEFFILSVCKNFACLFRVCLGVIVRVSI